MTRKSCYKCPVGKYSFTLNDVDCHDCPNNFNCTGGNVTLVEPGLFFYGYCIFIKFKGFWRFTNLSIELYKCNNPYFDVCLYYIMNKFYLILYYIEEV